MKSTTITLIAAGLLAALFTGGCKTASTGSEKSIRAVIPVTVTQLKISRMTSYAELSATSEFLLKAMVRAPVTGYIDKVQVNQGDAVQKGRLLVTLKTREASALQGDTAMARFTGLINVTSASAGIISSIDHPTGDYVTEGDLLIQVTDPKSLVFVLDVPFEMSGSVKINAPCVIALPDQSTVTGLIKSRFPSMAAGSQTARYIVKIPNPERIPGNLTGKIRLVRETAADALCLPKSCILTDETMQEFWVMKLINDSTAVKIPVTTGITSGDSVQVTRPVFSPADRFLSSGNYGLGDTVSVRVVKR